MSKKQMNATMFAKGVHKQIMIAETFCYQEVAVC